MGRRARLRAPGDAAADRSRRRRSAIREPWRLALALLDDAFDGAPPLERLALFAGRDPESIGVLRAMIERGVNAPLARGVGRVFDAIGAIVLARPLSRYEGQIAMEWNLVAEHDVERGSYPFAIDRERTPWELDLRPMVRRVIGDVLTGVGAGGSRRASITRWCRRPRRSSACCRPRRAARRSSSPAAAFNNALLVEELLARLRDRRVLLPRQAPPGDGGIALGQAVVADAARGEEVPCA